MLDRSDDLNLVSDDELDFVAPLAASLGQASVMPLRPKDKELLAEAEEFRFGPDESRIAWSLGAGPTVILVHGYSGRGVQMAALAQAIAAKGFRAVCFDAGGHGASRPEKVGFFTFMNDTRDLTDHLGGTIHALVGHSAGALGMMRARELFGVKARKYALICAPLFPYPPLNNMRAAGASEATLAHVKAILSDQFRMSWSDLAKGACFAPEADAALFAAYDRADQTVSYDNAEALATLWPNAQIQKTEDYGHNRILQAPETLAAVPAFLAG